MSKHLVDIDETALRLAQAKLGTPTIKETVNRALRAAGGDADHTLRRRLDALATLQAADRGDAWR